MKISQDTITEIQNRIEIEEVVSDYVSLKKKGQNLWACCPFHNEKSPSFSVAPAKGIYKCFGCGKAGDGISFIMEIEGVNYVEAMVLLAQKYGIEVQEEEQTDEEMQVHNEKESLYIILKFATQYFQDLLWTSEEGQGIGYSYFKQRGFTDQIIKKFELGYSLDAWDGLLKHAKANGFTEEMLEKAGLIIKKEDGNKKYDRFRGRVIFPIHNISGKPIAFGARILKVDKKQPKYLNSPETEVYHKSDVLYGISQAKQAIRQKDNCYLVEGYTDVISMHLCGVENVVASSGTSLTDGQIRIINRYSKNVTVLFDGDTAGIKAALRGTDMILEGGLHVKVVIFPEGEDPDSYSQKIGSTAFQKYLEENAKDFIRFKTELFAKEVANDPIKKADTIKELVSSIAKIPDPIERAVYIRECADILEIDEVLLSEELNKVLLKKHQREGLIQQKNFDEPDVENTEPEIREPKKIDIKSALTLQERESIRLLLNYGNNKIEEEYHLYDYLLQEISDIEFETPVYKEILLAFKQQLEAGQVVDAQYFLRFGSPQVKEEVANLLVDRYELSKDWTDKHGIYIPKEEEVLDKAVFQNILRLKFRVLQKLIHENMEKLRKVTDERELNKLLEIHTELKKSEIEIAKFLGIVISK